MWSNEGERRSQQAQLFSSFDKLRPNGYGVADGRLETPCPVKRQIYFAAGAISVALGSVGIFLPILPTVPFMILAAFCFARSSPRFEQRLLGHPTFGPHILAWRDRGIVSRKGKLAATGAFAVSSALGLLMLSMPWALIPAAVALITGTWLWLRPER